MSNTNRTQTIGADQPEAVISLDGEPTGSQSNGSWNKEVGKQPTSRRKKLLLLSAGIVIPIATAYFAWNAFRYEETDDAQVSGHVMELSARISGQVAEVPVIEGQI